MNNSLRDFPFPSILLLALCTGGCTLDQYTLPRGELERLAHAEPNQRSERVRLLQQTLYDSDDLGSAAAAAVSAAAQCDASWDPERPPCTLPGAVLDASKKEEDEDTSASDAAAAAALLLVLTGVVLAPIAVTEGVRYDGWAHLPPNQPLYLVHGRRWITLADLTPQDIHPGERAILPAGEDIELVERRPLDRVGLAFTLELTSARLTSARDPALWGYGGRIGLGGHPLQQLGVFAGAQFAYGSSGPEDRFLGRLFGSVEFLPVSAGIFHAGAFMEGGWAHLMQSTDATISTSGPSFGAGPLFQLALSTRLALTLRAGMSNVRGATERFWLPEGTLGVAVY